MPTVLERLAALFSRDMRAVLRNPRAISMIENPSERVQMAAIRRDRSVICFIDKPAEKVQLAAIKGAPHNIHFIATPCEKCSLPSYATGLSISVSFLPLRKRPR